MSKLRFLLMMLMLFGIASSLFAQEEIQIGDSVEGEEDDEAVEYELELEEDQSVGIRVEADDFDTYLELYDEDGFFLDSNDDYDGSTRVSYLTYTADDDMTLIIRVRSFGADGPEGDFTLTVEEVEVTEELDGGTLAYGDEVEVEPDGALAVVFTFEGTEGDAATILVVSESDDTRLTLEGPDGDEVATDDDSGTSTNPALQRVLLPATGTYTVTVTGYSETALFSEFEISLIQAEYLLVNDTAQTLTLDPDVTTDVMFLEAAEDVSYIITVTLSEDVDSSLYVNMIEEDQGFARSRFTASGTSGFSFVFTPEDDGLVRIALEFFTFEEEVDVTIEAQVLE